MMIGSIQGAYGFGGYNPYMTGAVPASTSGAPSTAVNPLTGQPEGGLGRTEAAGECQTCKNRKYQDGSDENVSFKSAAHISPGAAGAAVRAHEGEHVSNAFDKAKEAGGKVISASVSIHTAVCPECGRTYVSGGTTRTKISYPNEQNPYQQSRKSQDSLGTTGANVDFAV